MIYRWFKRNRPFPKARDVASRAHYNRSRKLASFMSDISECISQAVDRGDRQIVYSVRSEDAYLLPELVSRLRSEGYLVAHEPVDSEDSYYPVPLTLSWVPPKRTQ